MTRAMKIVEECFRGETGEGWWEQRQQERPYFKGIEILNHTLLLEGNRVG